MTRDMFTPPFIFLPFVSVFRTPSLLSIPLFLPLHSIKMLVLFETSAGFALFKLLKDGRLDKPEVRVEWRKRALES